MNGRIVGLDVGDVRIGIALSDETRLIATPHSVYTRVGWGPDVKHIQRIYEEARANLVVCGLPRNMDGTYGEQAEKVKHFAQRLIDRWDGDYAFYDERLTTMAARRVLLDADISREKRKQVIDKMAAVVILQGYMESRRNQL